MAISGNPLAHFLGCETLPAFVYRGDLSIVEKTIKINHYIYQLIYNKNPDIVILSHAGGFMPLNEYEHNYFGEISYILSNAVTSDYGIACHYYNPNYTKKYFVEFEKLCKIRLGIDILFSYVSNQSYGVDMELKKIEYLFFEKEFCEKSFLQDLYKEKNILTPNDNEGLEQAIDEIICLLNNNPEII